MIVYLLLGLKDRDTHSEELGIFRTASDLDSEVGRLGAAFRVYLGQAWKVAETGDRTQPRYPVGWRRYELTSQGYPVVKLESGWE